MATIIGSKFSNLIDAIFPSAHMREKNPKLLGMLLGLSALLLMVAVVFLTQLFLGTEPAMAQAVIDTSHQLVGFQPGQMDDILQEFSAGNLNYLDAESLT